MHVKHVRVYMTCMNEIQQSDVFSRKHAFGTSGVEVVMDVEQCD